MNTEVLEITNLVINLILFLVVVVAAIYTILKMRIHFNMGNKIMYFIVAVSLCMRIGLTIQEYYSKDYSRKVWKYYYKWFIELAFMTFYFNCFFKVIVSWEVSHQLKIRSDSIRTLSIKDQFKLLYDEDN